MRFFCKSVINNQPQSTMSSNNKRRRTTTSSTNDKHIVDLPDGLLVGISSYLAKPSVALFAIAMNNTNDSQTPKST